MLRPTHLMILVKLQYLSECASNPKLQVLRKSQKTIVKISRDCYDSEKQNTIEIGSNRRTRWFFYNSHRKENKTGSSQVGAISKAQKYSKNNYWKRLEKFFSKKFFEFFFSKNMFFRKSHNAEKLKKRPFRLIKRFYKPKTSKKCKGLPFERIRKFSKKKSHSAEKKRKKSNERKPSLVSHLLLEA